MWLCSYRTKLSLLRKALFSFGNSFKLTVLVIPLSVRDTDRPTFSVTRSKLSDNDCSGGELTSVFVDVGVLVIDSSLFKARDLLQRNSVVERIIFAQSYFNALMDSRKR